MSEVARCSDVSSIFCYLVANAGEYMEQGKGERMRLATWNLARCRASSVRAERLRKWMAQINADIFNHSLSIPGIERVVMARLGWRSGHG